MSQRGSAITWLIMSLFCALLSLVACGGGGWGIWHVEDRLKSIGERIKEDEKQKADAKNFLKQDKIIERLRESDKEESEYLRYRWFAIAGAAISLIPAFMTLAFLIMAVAKFMKKTRPVADEEDEEEEEDEEDEKPAAKQKTKPKDDD